MPKTEKKKEKRYKPATPLGKTVDEIRAKRIERETKREAEEKEAKVRAVWGHVYTRLPDTATHQLLIIPTQGLDFEKVVALLETSITGTFDTDVLAIKWYHLPVIKDVLIFYAVSRLDIMYLSKLTKHRLKGLPLDGSNCAISRIYRE